MVALCLAVNLGCAASQNGSGTEPMLDNVCVAEARAANREPISSAPQYQAVADGDVPVDTPLEVSSSELENSRRSGTTLLLPDGDTRDEMLEQKVSRISASFKLCLDETGKPSSIERITSSCSPRYDADIQRGMTEWRYKPYQKDGAAIPVCTTVVFVYSQKYGTPTL